MLDMLSNPDVADIMAWLPHGKGFMIRDKKRFASEVLPKYFKKSKFTSFTRKLNRWYVQYEPKCVKQFIGCLSTWIYC
jgi:HSF-type DNA-binding